MIKTEAWVIRAREDDAPAELELEELQLEALQPHEVLAAPLYGCWEGNMGHALRRKPVDVCRLRLESRVVLGNAGVVRVMAVGSQVTSLREGDVCALLPIGASDRHGFLTRVFGYDARGSVGMLARRTKLTPDQLFRIPEPSRHDLTQWAGISIRYLTAFDNWKVAHACHRAQVTKEDDPRPWAWGWGGGVALAELQLAARAGYRVAMVASTDWRLEQIRAAGIVAVDRRDFPDLRHDAELFARDDDAHRRYRRSEATFLRTVREITGGERVSVFIDNVGAPVHRATVKALARQGVITTAGWDRGGTLEVNRIEACMNRHLHVHTHGVRQSVGLQACAFMADSDWMPPRAGSCFAWSEIPELARRFVAGEIETYFPIFEVNTDLLT